MSDDFGKGMMELVLDPQFTAFERLANRPNLFRIVGRTYTETWHSMFLGWLLDPQGSHGLKGFALQRLLLAVAESLLTPEEDQQRAMRIAVFGRFEDAIVLPNERQPREQQIEVREKSGRLDCYVKNIKIDAKKDSAGSEKAVIVIEQKVYASPDTLQCKMYSTWMEQKHADDDRIPILLAPVPNAGERPVDDRRWFVLDYQDLNDKVLVPALEHPDLDPYVRPLLEQYADALRIPMNGTKLAVSAEEEELANGLYERHKTTFDTLFEVLTKDSVDPRLQALVQANRELEKTPLVITVDSEEICGESVSKLLEAVVRFLDKRELLEQLLPFGTGTKRYLIAKEPRHPSGKEFNAANELKTESAGTVFVEVNTSRQSALKYALALLRKSGLPAEVPEG